MAGTSGSVKLRLRPNPCGVTVTFRRVKIRLPTVLRLIFTSTLSMPFKLKVPGDAPRLEVMALPVLTWTFLPSGPSGAARSQPVVDAIAREIL